MDVTTDHVVVFSSTSCYHELIKFKVLVRRVHHGQLMPIGTRTTPHAQHTSRATYIPCLARCLNHRWQLMIVVIVFEEFSLWMPRRSIVTATPTGYNACYLWCQIRHSFPLIHEGEFQCFELVTSDVQFPLELRNLHGHVFQASCRTAICNR